MADPEPGRRASAGVVANGGPEGDAAPSKEDLIAGIRGWSNKPEAPSNGGTTDDRRPMVGVLSALWVAARPYRDDPDVRDALEEKFAEYDGDSTWCWDIWDQDCLKRDRGYECFMWITGQGAALAQVQFAKRPANDDAAMNAAIENPPDDFSENALARRFADLHGGNVRYAAKEGRWLEWDGSLSPAA